MCRWCHYAEDENSAKDENITTDLEERGETDVAEIHDTEQGEQVLLILFLRSELTMGKVKTFRDYEQDIRTAHTCNDDKTVHARVSKWADLVPLAFLVAQNEQKPYTCE